MVKVSWKTHRFVFQEYFVIAERAPLIYSILTDTSHKVRSLISTIENDTYMYIYENITRWLQGVGIINILVFPGKHIFFLARTME